MPEPLKSLYTKTLVANVGSAIAETHRDFDSDGFQRRVLGRGWKALELKGRMRRITEALTEHLPESFEESASIIRGVAPQFTGFEYMFFPEYVELNGLDDNAAHALGVREHTLLERALGAQDRVGLGLRDRVDAEAGLLGHRLGDAALVGPRGRDA